jgi:hypothetical protein
MSSEPPVIFNAPQSARPGDIVGLQGENFGSEPVVTLAAKTGEAPLTLPLVNQFGTGWVSFKVPESATSALVVRVSNGPMVSAPVKLNAARAYHLDAMQIVSGGAFRIFGRNLQLPGFTPNVSVDGLPAIVNAAASDEHMLSVTAPKGLRTTGKAVIAVDNGNGTGPSVLDRPIELAAGGGDPFALGVGWGAGFADIASRQALKVACSGVADDTLAVQSAMDMLAAKGGGVLQLAPGTCRFAGSLKLKSRVVLQGAGKDKTLIAYEASYPLWGRALDLVGVRDLTLQNIRGRIEGPLLQDSTRAFFQRVKFSMAGGLQIFFTGNKNFVVSHSEFIQPKNIDDNGPYHLAGCSGFYFANNTTTFANGSPDFESLHDSFVQNSRFTRDARNNQDSKGVIHSLAINFAHRIAIVGNTFDVIGGPITNKNRNDGETLLTEGGGSRHTENLGTVASAAATTLSDPANKINVMPFLPDFPGIPENYGVAIVGGKGAGQARRVIAYIGNSLTVDSPWDVVPDATSRYSTFVWGLEKSIIKGNTLIENPRGIWFYHTAVREVDIVENRVIEGGGIFLRSAQILKNRLFVPMYNIRIARNSVINTTKQWPSYINIQFVRTDEFEFGIGTIGIVVRDNTIRVNRPSLQLPSEGTGNTEGFTNSMRAEGVAQALSKFQIRLLGTIFQNNKCIGCETDVIVRDGAKGTVLEANSNLAETK